MTRLDNLREMLPDGFGVSTWSPGDGVTRYRFFDREPFSYFGGRGIYTALGYKEAETFARGICAGVWAEKVSRAEKAGKEEG